MAPVGAEILAKVPNATVDFGRAGVLFYAREVGECFINAEN